MPKEINQERTWWKFGENLCALRELVDLDQGSLVKEINDLVNTDKAKLERLGADIKQKNGHVMFSNSDISKYEGGKNKPERPRVLLFIYFFKSKGVLDLGQANELLTSLLYSALREHTEQFLLFGESIKGTNPATSEPPPQLGNDDPQNTSKTEDTPPAPQNPAPASSTRFVNQDFVNQDDVFCELRKHLRPGNIVGLWGTHGIGKTAIAKEFCRRWTYKPIESFSTGPLYFNLKQCRERRDFIKRCVENVNLTNEQETWPAVKSALENSCRVIVLDGFDEVEANWSAHELDDLMNSIFNNAFLLTSCGVPSVGYPVEVPILSDQHARELLVRYSQNAPNDWEVIDRIFISVRKLPLAIELTGRFLNTNANIDDHAKRLDDNALRELERLNNLFRRNYGDGKLSRTIGVSIAKLNDSLCRRLLGQATLFGFWPFQKSMLTAAIERPERYISDDTDEISDALDKLVIYGLLNRTNQEWYEFSSVLIYDFARAYIGRKMTERTSSQLDRYIQDTIETYPDKSDMWFTNFLHQVLEVLGYWVSNGYFTRTQNITDFIYTHVDFSLIPKLRKALIDKGLESIRMLAESNPNPENKNTLGEWLYRSGKHHADCGEITEAISDYRDALEELSADADSELISQIQSGLDFIYEKSPERQQMLNEGNRGDKMLQTDPTKALAHYQNAIDVAGKLKDWPNLVGYFEKAGDIHHTQWELNEARVCFTEALRIAQDKLKDLDLVDRLSRKLERLSPKPAAMTSGADEIKLSDEIKFLMPDMVFPSEKHMRGHDLEREGDKSFQKGDFKSARIFWLKALEILERDEEIWPCAAIVREKLAKL